MIYLIDGYNLIGSWHHVALKDKDKEKKMVFFLQKSLRDQDSALLYFDGRRAFDTLGGRETCGCVSVIYTPLGISADAAIQRAMGSYKQKKSVQIVSSDREIQKSAKELRLTCVPSDVFMKVLYAGFHGEEQDSKPEAMTSMEFRYWETCFQEK
jgi:predicted RNA-binding protein with PIN domain